MRTTKNKLLTVVGCGLACAAAQAGSAFYDFNAAPPPDLNFVGNAEWRDSNGVDGSGYMALFDSVDSQYAAVLIPDFDNGLVVKSFVFEVDLRIGNPTGEGGRPADGFSISYAHGDDPVVLDLAQEPPVNNNGNFSLAGAPENGTKTGLAISFDTWQGNTQPDGGADIEGIMINLNGVVVPVNGARGIAMPTRNGSCTDATSMQTGPYTGGLEGAGPSDVSGLCWAHLKVELDDAGKVTVTWKGTVIADHIPTGFAPSTGRIVFAGRTGGANENTHIDNLRITTVPSSTAVIGGATGTPTGFELTVSDSGQSVFDATAAGSITTFKFNGTAITPNRSSKNGSTTTLYYSNPSAPIAPGSANTVSLVIKDTLGTTISKDVSFTGINYSTIDPTWAATGVDKSKPGFVEKMYQVNAYEVYQGVGLGTDNANTGVSVASGERMLHGDLGANTADLTLFTGPGKTYTETRSSTTTPLSAIKVVSLMTARWEGCRRRRTCLVCRGRPRERGALTTARWRSSPTSSSRSRAPIVSCSTATTGSERRLMRIRSSSSNRRSCPRLTWAAARATRWTGCMCRRPASIRSGRSGWKVAAGRTWNGRRSMRMG